MPFLRPKLDSRHSLSHGFLRIIMSGNRVVLRFNWPGLTLTDVHFLRDRRTDSSGIQQIRSGNCECFLIVQSDFYSALFPNQSRSRRIELSRIALPVWESWNHLGIAIWMNLEPTYGHLSRGQAFCRMGNRTLVGEFYMWEIRVDIMA